MSSNDSPFSALPVEVKELIFFYALPQHNLTTGADLKAAQELACRRVSSYREYFAALKGRFPEDSKRWDKLRHLPEFDAVCSLAGSCRDGRAILRTALKWQLEILEAQRLALDAEYNKKTPKEVLMVMKDCWEWLWWRIKFVERLLLL